MKNLTAIILLALSLSANAEKIQWQDTGFCILSEQRIYDETADYPEDMQQTMQLSLGRYFLNDIVTVKTNSINELKLKGSLTHNETLHLKVMLPEEKNSLAGMYLSVKSNQKKFPFNTDLFAKGDQFYGQFKEQFGNYENQEMTTRNVRQFDRNIRLHSLFPIQSNLLKLEERILASIKNKKHFYAQSLVVFNNKYSDFDNADLNDLLGKYAGTLLGTSVTCFFEEK